MNLTGRPDIVIPTYRPDTEKLSAMLDCLYRQTREPKAVIIVNTGREYWDAGLEEKYPALRVIQIGEDEFDHGGTRTLGYRSGDGEIVVFMTQDAVPAGADLLEKLCRHFDEDPAGLTGAVYARQVPKENCSWLEAETRAFNYPEKGRVSSMETAAGQGIKAYFCSNVCAMYRRDVFDKLGGFTKKTIFNEDMVYAGTACQKGYAICYVPEAGVIHSHNYTYMQQFHRNFDLGVSQTEHPEIFGSLKSETEGKKMVKETIEHFRRIGKGYLIPDYVIMCGFRFLGYKLGRNYKKIPKGLVKTFSSNKEYFTKWK